MDIVRIGSSQSLKVMQTDIAAMCNIFFCCFRSFRPAPGEDGQAELLHQHIRDQPRMTAIAVGKAVDGDEPMVEADGAFFG